MHKCDNCGRVWLLEQLDPIKDLLQRVEPGEPMPSGECPKCGALCHPNAYATRVHELELEGLCTSDAQVVADAELEERCDCGERSWYGDGHDSACPVTTDR